MLQRLKCEIVVEIGLYVKSMALGSVQILYVFQNSRPHQPQTRLPSLKVLMLYLKGNPFKYALYRVFDNEVNKLGLSWAKLRPAFQLSTRFENIADLDEAIISCILDHVD